MSRKHYSPEQIIYKLREAEVLISQGLKTPEAVIPLEPKTILYAN